LRVDRTVEKKVVERLLNVKKKKRDQQAVNRALESLHVAAESESQNLMHPILNAVREYATIGEICNALRDTFGEYRPLTIF